MKRVTGAILSLACVLVAGGVEAQQTVGLFLNDERSFEGYTLFAPNPARATYLITNEGKLVRSWESLHRPGLSAYLLDDGSLLRTAQFAGGMSPFNAGGQGGRIQRFDWDGALAWSFDYSTSLVRQHHDIAPMPDGNILMIAWEYKTAAEAIAAGRNPALLNENELWPDHVVEIDPGGTVVWEWHVWDHLIQDVDPTKANFGTVADHPELVDLNYRDGANAGQADWLHTNGIDYDPLRDEIVLSIHGFSEIWVIDHGTSTSQAAGHAGGNSGMGGDLLYRWGNPEAYDRGTAADQKLFRQHDAEWVPVGYPGAGNITIFNNGQGRPGGNYSSVDEIVPPLDDDGNYVLDPGLAYGPATTAWTYTAEPESSFYATNISGAHRLPDGNTLICDGPAGSFFEVTPASETVWRYVNPISASGPITQGNNVQGNAVFRARRYAVDHPAFEGKDLTPGGPLELFDPPSPVPDGTGGSLPLTAARTADDGSKLRVAWDADTCPASGYHLLFGGLAQVSTYVLQGGECGIGVSGVFDWSSAPAGDLFFLVVGVDPTGVYESGWGYDGHGTARNGTTPSNLCGITNKDDSESCP